MTFLEWTFTALVIPKYSILRHTEKSQQVIRNLTPTLTTKFNSWTHTVGKN